MMITTFMTLRFHDYAWWWLTTMTLMSSRTNAYKKRQHVPWCFFGNSHVYVAILWFFSLIESTRWLSFLFDSQLHTILWPFHDSLSTSNTYVCARARMYTSTHAMLLWYENASSRLLDLATSKCHLPRANAPDISHSIPRCHIGLFCKIAKDIFLAVIDMISGPTLQRLIRRIRYARSLGKFEMSWLWQEMVYRSRTW